MAFRCPRGRTSVRPESGDPTNMRSTGGVGWFVRGRAVRRRGPSIARTAVVRRSRSSCIRVRPAHPDAGRLNRGGLGWRRNFACRLPGRHHRRTREHDLCAAVMTAANSATGHLCLDGDRDVAGISSGSAIGLLRSLELGELGRHRRPGRPVGPATPGSRTWPPPSAPARCCCSDLPRRRVGPGDRPGSAHRNLARTNASTRRSTRRPRSIRHWTTITAATRSLGPRRDHQLRAGLGQDGSSCVWANQSTVATSPSGQLTCGCQPRTRIAREVSGRRTWGSSTGRSTYPIADFGIGGGTTSSGDLLNRQLGRIADVDRSRMVGATIPGSRRPDRRRNRPTWSVGRHRRR